MFLSPLQEEGSQQQQQEAPSAFPNGAHPPLLSRRQSLETQYLKHRLQVPLPCSPGWHSTAEQLWHPGAQEKHSEDKGAENSPAGNCTVFFWCQALTLMMQKVRSCCFPPLAVVNDCCWIQTIAVTPHKGSASASEEPLLNPLGLPLPHPLYFKPIFPQL